MTAVVGGLWWRAEIMVRGSRCRIANSRSQSGPGILERTLGLFLCDLRREMRVVEMCYTA